MVLGGLGKLCAGNVRALRKHPGHVPETNRQTLDLPSSHEFVQNEAVQYRSNALSAIFCARRGKPYRKAQNVTRKLPGAALSPRKYGLHHSELVAPQLHVFQGRVS